jgi:hypothetical protein
MDGFCSSDGNADGESVHARVHGKGKDIKGDRGWIAQEFEQVFPDLIDEWKDPAPEGEDPYKSVRADLIPVLVKAIQEQQAIITQLQADVAALKAA